MGCNSSSVVPLSETDKVLGPGIKVRVNPSTPETAKASPANGVAKHLSGRKSNTRLLESIEPPVETLTRDFNTLDKGKTGVPPPPPPPPPPLAFDVPIHQESLIKKHPPKKFRRLQSQQLENVKMLTHEELNNKLQEAEMRRREILNQRIQSAQQKNNQYRQLMHTADVLSQKSEESATETEKTVW